MSPVCDGAGSHFVLEQSLMIFVLRPSASTTLYHKYGQNSCILVVSDQHFKIWPRRASGHVIPFKVAYRIQVVRLVSYLQEVLKQPRKQ